MTQSCRGLRLFEAEEMKTCPQCKNEVHNVVSQCACGYEFPPSLTSALPPARYESAKVVATALKVIAALALIGSVIMVVAGISDLTDDVGPSKCLGWSLIQLGVSGVIASVVFWAAGEALSLLAAIAAGIDSLRPPQDRKK